MPSLDVFKSDAFSMTELTASINRAPFVPGRLGASGLFDGKGIYTTTVMVERKGNKLALIESAPRGSKGQTREKPKGKVRTFTVPHFPKDDEILADSIQNIRDFGSETALKSVSSEVNDALDSLRQDHEATHEYLRIGALKGVIVDGDGSTELYDLFDEFGITQTAVDFALGTTTTEVKEKIESVRRSVEDALGVASYSGITAYCGDSFWDKLVKHTAVKAAYDRWKDGDFFRQSQREHPGTKGGFEFCGVWWENYRGKVGTTSFIPTADCRFAVEGVPGLFIERYAPGDMTDTVNTKGQPVYAIQEELPFRKGIKIHTQSNFLALCTQPELLIRGYTSN